MRRIRLGVIFDQHILSGGGYQQNLNDALLVRDLPVGLAEVIFYTTLQENVTVLAGYGIDAKCLCLSPFEKFTDYIRRHVSSSRLNTLVRMLQRFSNFEKILINNQIDLVYFLSPSILARSLENLNYITTVWDLCHRDCPEFPEVRSNRILESRDYLYTLILPGATAIFVDSEIGKTNVTRRYALDSERIHVMPFREAEATRRIRQQLHSAEICIPEKYQIDVPYIFYPAQFWPHKNHVYLLEGLRLLETHYSKRVGAIFSGGDKGNLSYIKRYANSLGLQDRIRFVGFVANTEIIDLYLQSVALVMPTYFGPTNLPPLEAFGLGVPVLYPDKPGLRDQVGNAALLMDLRHPESMAMHLNNLLDDDDLRCDLIAAGYERSNQNDVYDRTAVLVNIIEDFRWRRLCWQ